METPLAQVRGLGAAHHGGRDWWAVRLNSVALLVLSIWLLVSLLRLPAFDLGTITEWLRSPFAAVPMLLFIATTFWHIEKGLREVIDDYVHGQSRVFWIILIAFFVWTAGALAAFDVLKIAIGGGAA